jgi:uncharacterized protein (DUF1501 family)
MPKNTHRLSRRSMLDLGLKAAATAGLTSFLRPVSAATMSDRVCVCIYLLGGNDSNNMVVPLDGPAYSAYSRGRGGLALAASSLLPVQSLSTSSGYGFHPALSGVQDLYNRRALAVVANVGRAGTMLTASAALTKGQFDPAQLPADLFLHTGASQVQFLPSGSLAVLWDAAAGQDDRAMRSSIVPGATLSQRLAQVANELSRSSSRCTFTVALSGFDTHADELTRQASLFAELNDGLVSFYQSLQDLGIGNRVTVFTSTEFNRTLVPNARGGTDHAWGGHNLVLGGPVLGGEFYGRFPSLAVGGPDDLGASGIWIPSVTDEQFSATLARWYGADLTNSFRHVPVDSPEMAFLVG